MQTEGLKDLMTLPGVKPPNDNKIVSANDGKHVYVTRRSQFTGKVRQIKIEATTDQINAWVGGTLIQDALPHLSEDEREFLMTGATPMEWYQLKFAD